MSPRRKRPEGQRVTRGGRAKERDDPERKCLVTGEVQPKRGLVRFALSPEDVVVPDVAGKLPGRGMWLSADRAVMEQAVQRNAFARAARRPVTAPPTLADDVEALLARRVIEAISLARKAGDAVAGFEKVKDWLAKEQAKILLQASDGSGRGKDKLHSPPGKGSFIGILTSSELGMAFGRERVIHAALAAGGLTTRVVEDAGRLSGLREGDGGVGAAAKGKKTT